MRILKNQHKISIRGKQVPGLEDLGEINISDSPDCECPNCRITKMEKTIAAMIPKYDIKSKNVSTGWKGKLPKFEKRIAKLESQMKKIKTMMEALVVEG